MFFEGAGGGGEKEVSFVVGIFVYCFGVCFCCIFARTDLSTVTAASQRFLLRRLDFRMPRIISPSVLWVYSCPVLRPGYGRGRVFFFLIF